MGCRPTDGGVGESRSVVIPVRCSRRWRGKLVVQVGRSFLLASRKRRVCWLAPQRARGNPRHRWPVGACAPAGWIVDKARRTWLSWVRVSEGCPGPSATRWRRRGSPAIQFRFSRFRGAVQQGPAQRQKAQIVQSCNTLDDFLPGFGLPRIRCHRGTGTASSGSGARAGSDRAEGRYPTGRSNTT